MSYVCLSDIYPEREEYTAALGRLTSATGLGIVTAPLLATVLMSRGGGPRRAYMASALLAAIHLFVGAKFLQETKVAEELPDDSARMQCIQSKQKPPLLRP